MDCPPSAVLGFKPDTIEVVRAGMQAVVDGGTGWRARLPGIEVAARRARPRWWRKARLEKSPTVHAIMPHGWFVAFAPAEKPRDRPRRARGARGERGEAAAPVAREILAAYFGAAGRALPRRRGSPTPSSRWTDDAAIDRRLVFNIDWVLLVSDPPPRRHRRRHHLLGHPLRRNCRSLREAALPRRRWASWRSCSPSLVDYRRLADRAVLFYVRRRGRPRLRAAASAPLIAGTRRWILLGGFQLQPSEFVKIVAALLVAKIFAESRMETPGPARHRSARGRRWGSSRCSSRASPTSAPRSACSRSSWPWPSWPACA